jgi:hypothetical protein
LSRRSHTRIFGSHRAHQKAEQRGGSLTDTRPAGRPVVAAVRPMPARPLLAGRQQRDTRCDDTRQHNRARPSTAMVTNKLAATRKRAKPPTTTTTATLGPLVGRMLIPAPILLPSAICAANHIQHQPLPPARVATRAHDERAGQLTVRSAVSTPSLIRLWYGGNISPRCVASRCWRHTSGCQICLRACGGAYSRVLPLEEA